MAEKKIKVRKPRRIVFFSPNKKERDQDTEVLYLIGRGRTMAYILARVPGFSKHKYAYLAKRGDARLADARNALKGTLGGEMERAIEEKMRDVLEPIVLRHIRNNVTPPQTLSKAHTSSKGENPYPLQEEGEKKTT